jgi:hypothetical protein
MLTFTDFLGLIAIFLNIFVLAIATYQTYLSRKSLDITRQTIEDDRKLRELELLPKANFIIHVNIYLDKWIDEIDRTKEEIEIAFHDKNDFAFKDIAERSLKSPECLVDEHMYKRSPDWLAEIYISAAKYYYNCLSITHSLWDQKQEEARYYMVEDITTRCNESLVHLRSLKGYMDDVIPDSYLDAPDSIPDYKFFGK